MIVSNKLKYNYFWQLALLIVLPSLFYVSFSLSSLSFGLLIGCFVILLFNIFNIYIKDIKGWPLFGVVLFFIYELFKTVILGLSLVTLLQIFLSFILLLLVSQNLVYNSIKTNFKANIKYISVFIIVILLINVFDFRIGNYINFHKPKFPFSEPSHMALTLGYFLPTVFFLQRKSIKIMLFFLFIFFGFYYESLSFIIVVFASYIISVGINFKLFFTFFTVSCFSFFIITNYDIINYEYYLNRLDYQNSDNLSLLVFFQGWEIIIESLKSLSITGVGLNNLESFTHGEISNSIYEILGEYKNRQGGGFLASKIIGEMGIVGLIILISYLKFIYSKLKNISNTTSTISFFYSSILFISLFELFFRGLGYFTIGTVLVMCSLIYFKTND